MTDDRSYTTEEVSKILKVSKLTVYDLIKKGKLPAYQVGRQKRIEAKDLEAYINQTKSGLPQMNGKVTHHNIEDSSASLRSIIISGQDMVLDMLGSLIEKSHPGYRSLRSYEGSLNSLISMYKGECDIVSMHLFDGDTGEYNIPYVKKILVNDRYIVLNLLSRRAGFYVQQGNPKQIKSWEDLTDSNVKIVNREKGSGARTLLDEQLRIHHISTSTINGYDQEETNHLAVAAAIAQGKADAGVGIEKAAKIVGVEFIPLIKERYDIVLIKSEQNLELIDIIKSHLLSDSFKKEIESIGGYDVSMTGSIIYETC
ncbi:substrate-binding domain-containing protein [Scopulibacillus cellulosilyticus]|uniref:Substrate-binding domain-containing protein n=1 Tax=Scopulibacillus cellulosilyticus TaxID=2665665 RepID=A0ABW2PS05_9BACL